MLFLEEGFDLLRELKCWALGMVVGAVVFAEAAHLVGVELDLFALDLLG